MGTTFFDIYEFMSQWWLRGQVLASCSGGHEIESRPGKHLSVAGLFLFDSVAVGTVEHSKLGRYKFLFASQISQKISFWDKKKVFLD